MKTKEIDVWIDFEKDCGTQSGTIWFGEQVVTRNPNSNFTKCKLLVPEIAERDDEKLVLENMDQAKIWK